MKKLIGIKFLAVALILVSLTTDTMAQTRITFGRGRTSATVTGTLGSGSTREYVLTARESQTMTISLSSGNDEVTFDASDVHGSFGEHEDGYAQFDTDANGNHWITLENTGNRATKYTMRVTIR
ncbi:MAG: hypothetical protein WA584_06220 [Pyrinomonadaceae bacterium]